MLIFLPLWVKFRNADSLMIMKIHSRKFLRSFMFMYHRGRPAKCERQSGKKRSRGRDRKTIRQIYNGTDWGGQSGRWSMREKQSCGEKAPAPVGFRSVWIAKLCTHSGLSLSSSPPLCLLKAGILFLSVGILCLCTYFPSCPLCICVYVCVFVSALTLFNYRAESNLSLES